MQNKIEKTQYFKFEKGREVPVFIRLHGDGLINHTTATVEKFGFKKCDEKIYNNFLKQKKKFHLLNIIPASAHLAQVIRTGQQNIPSFGVESMTPFKNYQVYKYQNYGMMVVSPFNSVWELGVLIDPTKKNELEIFSVMLTRYVSMALAEYNMVSFWGVPVEEGIVVMNQAKAKNEIIILDLENMNVLSVDGVKSITGEFFILRLDAMMRSETRTMKKEELFSFLITHTSYLSYYGPSATVRAHIYNVINFSVGKIYPEENFMPRTDLPLAS